MTVAEPTVSTNSRIRRSRCLRTVKSRSISVGFSFRADGFAQLAVERGRGVRIEQ